MPDVNPHIEITPGVAGGRPRIAGHRIRVQDIVVWHESLGYAPEEIVAQNQGLSLADVYAALAYYYDHADEIRRHISDDETLANELRGRTPSKLLDKLAKRNGDDTLSPR